MSGKRIWGQKYRADGKTPPPIIEGEIKRSPSNKWRALYACKPVKGDHQFVLVGFDPWHRIKEETTQQYYERQYNKYLVARETRDWAYMSFYWVCNNCGKKEWDSIERPSRKVRDHAEIPEWFNNLTK